MKIEVCFAAEKNPDRISRMIQKALSRDYSHTLIKFRDIDQTVKIFHAVTKGVCVQTEREFYRKHIDILEKEVELNCTLDEFKKLTVAWNGVEYAESKFINCALDAIGLGFLDFSDNEGNKMICSELVARVLHKWSVYQFTKDFDSINPVEIEDILNSI